MRSQFRSTLTNRSTDKDNWSELDVSVDWFIHNIITRGHPIGGKDGTGIIAATFQPNSRLEEKNIVSVTGLILDIDGKFRKTDGVVPDGAVVSDDGLHYTEIVTPDALLRNLPFCGVAHSSHSHTPDLPKYRVILPLAEPVTRTEFTRLWFWIYEKIGRKCDASCKNPGRMFFLPRCTELARNAGWPWIRPLYGKTLSASMIPDDFEIPEQFRYLLTRPARKQGAHTAPTHTHYAPTDARKLLEALIDLPIYEWAIENAELLKYPVWRGLATNIAAAVLADETAHAAGAAAFHAISAGDSTKYTYRYTEETFRGALASAASHGPVRYSTLVAEGAPEALGTDSATEGCAAPVVHARKHLAASEYLFRAKQRRSADHSTGAQYVETDTPINKHTAQTPTTPENTSTALIHREAVVPDAVELMSASNQHTTPDGDGSDSDDPEVPASLMIDKYLQTNVLLDVHRNAYILKETNPASKEVVWALDKPIKEEALNKMLIAMGLPRKQLDDWKQHIEFFHFRRCVYTSDKLLITVGPSVLFNTYKPPKLVPIPGNWDNIRALFLHLVGGDPAALEYFLDWCAAPLQKIYRREPPTDGHYKNGSSIVLRGDPGAGKGTAMQILMLCYGMTNCVTLGQEDLDGKFHSNLLDKLFVIGNEVMSSSNRSVQTANKLKSWITDPYIPCEGKFSDAMEAENNFNIIFTSNDERPVLLEKGDRRYTVFQSARAPQSVITPVRDDLVMGQHEVAAFYSAMLSRQIKIRYGQLYETTARLHVQLASASTSDRFAAAVVEDGFLSVAAGWKEGARNGEIRDEVIAANNEFYVTSDTLASVYKHFCQTMGAHPQHIRALTQALQAVLPAAEPSVRVQWAGVQRRAWRGLPLTGTSNSEGSAPTIIHTPTTAPSASLFATALRENGFSAMADPWKSDVEPGEVRCEFVEHNGEILVTSETLVAVYMLFCERADYPIQHVRELTRALQETFPQADGTRRIRVEGTQRRAWCGLPMTPPTPTTTTTPPTTTTTTTTTTTPTPTHTTTTTEDNIQFGDTPPTS